MTQAIALRQLLVKNGYNVCGVMVGAMTAKARTVEGMTRALNDSRKVAHSPVSRASIV